MTMGVDGGKLRRRRQAAFWGLVARTMKRQGASGSTYAAARDIAYQTRRRSSSFTSPSRYLLEVARVFGYGTRIGRPLAIWLAGATVATVLLTIAAGLHVSTSGEWLLLDVLTSPTAFLKPSGIEDSLGPIVNVAGGVGRFILVGARILGTACLVFAAIAIGMHTRIGGIGRSEG